MPRILIVGAGAIGQWLGGRLAARGGHEGAAAELYVAEALLEGTTAIVDHHESPGLIDGSLDVLADAGFEYDSSIVPVRHDLYGLQATRDRRRPDIPIGEPRAPYPQLAPQFGLGLGNCGAHGPGA